MRHNTMHVQVVYEIDLNGANPSKQSIIDARILSPQASGYSVVLASPSDFGTDDRNEHHNPTDYLGQRLHSIGAHDDPWLLVRRNPNGSQQVSVAKQLLDGQMLSLIWKVAELPNWEYESERIHLWVGKAHKKKLTRVLKTNGYQLLLDKLNGDFQGDYALCQFHPIGEEVLPTDIDIDIAFLQVPGVGLSLEQDSRFPNMWTTTVTSGQDFQRFMRFIAERFIKETQRSLSCFAGDLYGDGNSQYEAAIETFERELRGTINPYNYVDGRINPNKELTWQMVRFLEALPLDQIKLASLKEELLYIHNSLLRRS